jgi:hypothetical protein
MENRNSFKDSIGRKTNMITQIERGKQFLIKKLT